MVSGALSGAGQQPPSARTDSLKVVEIKEADGQILSYRHLAGSMEVHMRGTRRAPEARIKLKVGSRPGFVELDINRGGITGLKPAHRLGKDFLTYVVWAVSVDGRASNLGEITFEDVRPISVNLTTPYQTFWLMVTAEPNYAVVDPSPEVVLYSVKGGSASETTAITIPGDLFYFTHYYAYETAPGDALERVPNQLLQARKAMELVSKAGTLPAAASGSAGLKEEEYSRKAITQAHAFLARAEEAYKQDPKRQEVIQFARTAAQSAENARALAMGVVGGLVVSHLESQVVSLRSELAARRTVAAVGSIKPTGEPVNVVTEPPEPVAAPPPPPPASTPLAKQPALWFGVAGWGLAIVLLFRRRPI
jgi:hypothetical protein